MDNDMDSDKKESPAEIANALNNETVVSTPDVSPSTNGIPLTVANINDINRHTHTVHTLVHSHGNIPGHSGKEESPTSFTPGGDTMSLAPAPAPGLFSSPAPAPAQDPVIRYKQVIDLSTLENGIVKQIALYNGLAHKIKFPPVIFLKAGDIKSSDEVRFNDSVYIVRADDPNMVLNFVSYDKKSSSRVKNYKALDRKLMFVNLFKDDKQHYVFRLRPMIGEDKKPLKRREPIQSGDKFTIAFTKDYYNGCGFGGCRVLIPISGHFSHGGKDPKKVPFVVVNKKGYQSTNEPKQTQAQTPTPTPTPIPPAPTTPGCYQYSNDTCPKQKSFNRQGRWFQDTWGEKNKNAGESKENCAARAKAFDRWCGSTDYISHFNPK